MRVQSGETPSAMCFSGTLVDTKRLAAELRPQGLELRLLILQLSHLLRVAPCPRDSLGAVLGPPA